jgi:hypothetical protein
MAYKFQLGDARLSGSTTFEQALAGESTISASSTLAGQALNIDNGAAQITSTGAATLASLNNSSGGITNAGSIAGATTISGSGLISGHALDIETDANLVSLTASANVVANKFFGDGAAITGITADTIDVTSSAAADTGYQLVYTQRVGNDTDLGATAGQLSWHPNQEGAALIMSGTYEGYQSSQLVFGEGGPSAKLVIQTDDEAVDIKSPYQITISGSHDDGITLKSGEATNAGVFIVGEQGLKGMNAAENGTNWEISQAGAVSGAAGVTGFSLNFDQGNINSDGGGNLNATTVSGSGKGSFVSIALDSVDVTSTAAELNKLDGATAAVTAAKLSTLSDLTDTEIGYMDGATAGGALASKALVVDAQRDIDNINILSASYLAGDGSSITNITVGNLDAFGSDTQVQFNQNGEFGANANFTYDGSGSVATSVLLSSADLKATNLVAGRLPLVSTAGLLDDNALFGYSTTRPAQLGNRAGLIVSSSASGSSYLMEGAFYAYDENSELIWDVVSTGMRSRTSVTISGSNAGADAVGLSVNSKMDGGASITAVGHINVGAGGGDFDIILNSNGNISGSGNLNIGGDSDFAGGLFPDVDNSYDLGENAKQWKDLHLNGVAYIDELQADQLGAALDANSQSITNINVDSGAIDGTVIGANSQAAAEFTTVSGSGNFNIGGTLNADNLGTIALGDIDVTSDLMVANDSATGALKNMSLANYATKLASASDGGLGSTAGLLNVDLFDLAGAAVDVAADSIAIVDADDSNGTRKESIADLVTAMAGAGLAASAGVLSTQAQSVSTEFNAGVAIEEGYNIYTGSADISVALPASAGLSAGDVFVVKQNATGEVTINADGSDTIDGEDLVVLESPYAAVSVVYSGVGGQFRIV